MAAMDVEMTFSILSLMALQQANLVQPEHENL